MRWRIVPLRAYDGFMNMAIDEAISESVSTGSPGAIRFYRWKPSAVSVGYFQRIDEEVDIAECRRLGVDCVRRRTGGGAVYHDFEGEITYSLIAPQTSYGPDIPATYRVICGYVVESLRHLGLEAEFCPVNDVLVHGKKISGSAQTRRGGVLLQHGTVLLSVDRKKMFRLLRVGEDKMVDKATRSVESRVTSIADELGRVSMEEVYEALIRGFTSGKAWDFGELTRREVETAQELVTQRYDTKEWNFLR